MGSATGSLGINRDKANRITLFSKAPKAAILRACLLFVTGLGPKADREENEKTDVEDLCLFGVCHTPQRQFRQRLAME
jgi:hypothetical protein